MGTEADDYSPDDRAAARQLSEGMIEAIDREILKNVSDQWRKMAHVIGHAMAEIRGPDVDFAERIRALVLQGRLEARGDLARMRYCEVRLSQPSAGRQSGSIG